MKNEDIIQQQQEQEAADDKEQEEVDVESTAESTSSGTSTASASVKASGIQQQQRKVTEEEAKEEITEEEEVTDEEMDHSRVILALTSNNEQDKCEEQILVKTVEWPIDVAPVGSTVALAAMRPVGFSVDGRERSDTTLKEGQMKRNNEKKQRQQQSETDGAVPSMEQTRTVTRTESEDGTEASASRPPSLTRPSRTSAPGAFSLSPIRMNGYSDRATETTQWDEEQARRSGHLNTTDEDSSGRDPEHIVSATLVEEDNENNSNPSGHGDLVVEAKPALQGFTAIVKNERFKYVAAFFGIVLLAIVVPLALLLPGKSKAEDAIVVVETLDSSLVCGQKLVHQADYRGYMNVTETGRQCQNWADQVPHAHGFNPEEYLNADLVENYCRSTGEYDEWRAWCYTTDPDLRWEYCTVPFCGEDEMSVNDACGSLSHRQKDYRGSISVTATGKKCMPWNNTTPHSGYRPESLPHAALESNFCRNPDGEPSAWCYTMEEETRWELCDVPICGSVTLATENNTCTDCTTAQCGTDRHGQADYTGTINTTMSGRPCLRWDSDIAQAGAFRHTSRLYPDGVVLEENYCRNPTYRADGQKVAWCWVEDNLWEHCDVPFCEDTFAPRRLCGSASKSQADYRGDVAVTETGNECIDWSVSSEAEKNYWTPKQSPFFGLQKNYCRNPANSRSRAWCYTDGGSTLWEYCNVEDCHECGTASLKKADYRGSQSVTRSGKTCKFWHDKALVHFFDNSTHFSGNHSAQLIEWGIEENYCRNPSGEQDSVWCFTDDESDDWDFCDVASCEEDLQPASSGVCGSISARQTDYRGSSNVTISGKACQAWTSQDPHRHKYTPDSRPSDGLDGNYCRNPGGVEPVAWCFTEDDTVRFEYCSVPRCEGALKEDCGTPGIQQKDYRGTMNVTASGIACQSWQSQDPHPHRYTSPDHVATSGLEENYCRNPDGSEKAWCFTADANVTWEYCDVSNC